MITRFAKQRAITADVKGISSTFGLKAAAWRTHRSSSRVYQTTIKSYRQVGRAQSVNVNSNGLLELQSVVEARQKLEAQQQENQGVQKEFAKLPDDANIYKLVGPVLLKQEKTEAVMAVDGRLEYIEKEM